MDERLIPILQETDLAQHFACILPSIQAKCHKPDPKIFQQVLDRLRIPAADCAHIGDNIEKDYYGAKGVGMNAFVIDRDKTARQQHNDIPKEHFLQDLTELETKVFQEIK
ncbi:haloacid dehalogenase-like hydrolase domain-containing protein 3 [Amphiura filiformis]|uniref:haloacid dehalogenase-like hydrolase domain-containing protein 3 n=1 Tax=Amphiura filiformis TaxID=82378 RepID=UPI003B221DF1